MLRCVENWHKVMGSSERQEVDGVAGYQSQALVNSIKVFGFKKIVNFLGHMENCQRINP